MSNNFNRIAWAYDSLVKITFGSRLWQAQRAHLEKIAEGDSVLVVGGGSGRILNWIKAEKIDFLELSHSMIRKASKRGDSQIIHGDFFSISLQTYDWVIFPFFLDCFADNRIKDALVKAKAILNEDGGLIVTDFEIQNKRQKLLTRLMIVFFRLTTALEAKNLSPIRQIIGNTEFQCTSSEQFLNGFIFSEIYTLRKK